MAQRVCCSGHALLTSILVPAAYMTAGCILLLYVVRKLGLVEMENDQLRASQQALLRQVGTASTCQNP